MNKTFIIAECGINHNGNIEIAKQLIEGAKCAGADAVKFQKRTIDRVYTKDELNKYRESPWGITQREQKHGIEFNESQYDEINNFCSDVGIDWFASVWDLESVKFLEKYNLKYNKIPSPLLTHKKLLIDVAAQQKLTFISTGMSTIEEIEKAVDIFRNAKCNFILMHCNSSYPVDDKELNVSCIQTLRNHFDCSVGYSGHSPGITDGVLAVALGAVAVEKHITINRTLYGTDQSSSLEIHGFAKMIEYIHFIEDAIGDGIKRVTDEEEKIKLKLRRYDDI